MPSHKKPAQKAPKNKLVGGGSRYKVPNLERGLRIMEYLVDHPGGLSQSELSAQLRYSKTSVFRIATTLIDYGYLLRDEESKNLTLSRKLLAMGSKALHEKDLMGCSMDILRRLRDHVRETVLIGTLAGADFIVLEQVLGSYPFKFSVDIGATLPLHTAAPAKAMLAFMSESEREPILNRLEFPRFNDSTVASLVRFREELATVRKQGYAVDCGEQLAGIHCVAASVFDRHGRPVAAIWATGPADRVRVSDFPALGRLLSSEAMVISGRLGYGLVSAAPR